MALSQVLLGIQLFEMTPSLELLLFCAYVEFHRYFLVQTRYTGAREFWIVPFPSKETRRQEMATFIHYISVKRARFYPPEC